MATQEQLQPKIEEAEQRVNKHQAQLDSMTPDDPERTVVQQLLLAQLQNLAELRKEKSRLFEVVNGDTLASLGRHSYQRAAAAALRALTTLQSVDGFLHGDVHLRNIMLVRNDTADDTAATCVLLDLGRARFGASVEEQQQEREELRQRLKA